MQSSSRYLVHSKCSEITNISLSLTLVEINIATDYLLNMKGFQQVVDSNGYFIPWEYIPC